MDQRWYKTYTAGMFNWSVYTNHLEKVNIRGCGTLQKKQQLAVVGYLLLLCCDICLSSRNSVSKNPRFESILGVFDSRESS